jgi:hypothetical protein
LGGGAGKEIDVSKNFFLDTEFAETGGWMTPTIDLISIGIVCEDGREFYRESKDFNIHHCDEWVRKNVVSKLKFPENKRTDRSDIRDQVKEFLGEEPIIWGYYADYDWVVFCWLFGKMVELPKGYPMFCRDLQQWYVDLGKPEGVKPPDPVDAHNALADAKWTFQFYNALKLFETKRLDAQRK